MNQTKTGIHNHAVQAPLKGLDIEKLTSKCSNGASINHKKLEVYM
jgi:hypothetical protein